MTCHQCTTFLITYLFLVQIVNKSSWERGFAHGSVYKTEIVDLSEKVKGEDGVVFGIKPGDPKVSDKLDADGLPPIGTKLNFGDPFYSYINLNTGQSHVFFYKYVISIIYCEINQLSANYFCLTEN